MESSNRARKSIRWLFVALTVAFAAALTAVVTFAGPIDEFDSDLVPDGFDNCLVVNNGPYDPSDQVDSDQDGYGNACDCDFNNNFVCDINDFAEIGATFLTALGDPGYNPNHDINGNDQIDINDYSAVGAGFQAPPGPSGLACAGTIVCP